MLKKADATLPEERHFVLTAISPGPAQKRLALGIVLGLLVVLLLITGPLAGIHLGANNGFYNCSSFGVNAVSSGSNPLQTMGAGNYYLAAGGSFIATRKL